LAKNEVEHLKTLSHKHVIKYYGCLAETHFVVIYMEFMPGGSLRHIIDNVGAMNETTAVKYIRQILDGLAYIHSKLILHSDLKCRYDSHRKKIWKFIKKLDGQTGV
jgi:serine/threonine protein kinase